MPQFNFHDDLLNRIFLAGTHTPKFIKKPIFSILEKLLIPYSRSLKTPLYLYFYVTDKCNARCSHCFRWRTLNKETTDMDLSKVEKIAKSLKEPIRTLHLTGGEPFLRNDFGDICKIFSEYNKISKINIPTNGYLSDKITDILTSLIDEIDVKINVIVSLDGTEKVHNKIRGINSYEKSISTIKKLKELNKKDSQLTVSALSVISKRNYDQISEIKAVIEKLGVPHGFQPIRSSSMVFGIGEEYIAKHDPQGSELLSIHELENFIKLTRHERFSDFHDKISDLTNYYFLDILKNKKKIFDCMAGRVDGVIYPNGDVGFCEMLKPFGNLESTDWNFLKLWRSGKANNQRKILSCCCVHPCNISTAICFNKNTLEKILE